MSTATEMDFGEARRGEAQLALRSVLGRVDNEPYAGSRVPAGEVLLEFTDVEAAKKHYASALIADLTGLGAEIRIGDMAGVDMVATPNVIHEPEPVNGSAPNYPPAELIIITGVVPGNALAKGRVATPAIMEACAELVRVMLATAVVAAAEDCEDNEGIVVYFQRMPELGGMADFESGRMVGLCRVIARVFCEREPRVSYLLGAVYGMTKAPRFVWDFPMVEYVYGPNRLRWADLRSPGYDPLPAEKKLVLAS